MVVYYTVTPTGAVSGPVELTQDSGGVPGGPERADHFGQVLAALPAGVLVGQPEEDVGTLVDAGMLTVLPAPGVPGGPGPYAATQDTPGIPGAAEAGDRLGAALDTHPAVGRAPERAHPVWVSAPREDLGELRDAGLVHRLVAGRSSFTSVLALTQDSPGVPGAVEAGDRFGASVLSAAWDGGQECTDPLQAALGAPGEDVGTVRDAGSVTLFHSDLDGTAACSDMRSVHQGADAEAGDKLGTSLGRIEHNWPSPPYVSDEVLMGAPAEDVGAAVDAGLVDTRHGDAHTRAVARAGVRFGQVLHRLALGWGSG